jgi:hypothetical protein
MMSDSARFVISILQLRISHKQLVLVNGAPILRGSSLYNTSRRFSLIKYTQIFANSIFIKTDFKIFIKIKKATNAYSFFVAFAL